MTVTDRHQHDLLEVREAVFSDDRAYRYSLSRIWDQAVPALVVIGLNPSSADARLDDATVRRVRGFAHREQRGGLIMVNCFGLRSTNPKALYKAEDPVGPDNDAHLRSAMTAGAPVVAAWGPSGTLHGRAGAVLAIARELEVPISCLGRTRNGHPRHPLYLPADTALEPYEEPR
jgi:hypothetical protein